MTKTNRNVISSTMAMIMMGGVIAETYFFIPELGNISFIFYWFIICAGIISPIILSKEDIKKSKKGQSKRLGVFFSALSCCTLVVCGWLVTATFYGMSTLIIHTVKTDD